MKLMLIAGFLILIVLIAGCTQSPNQQPVNQNQTSQASSNQGNQSQPSSQTNQNQPQGNDTQSQTSGIPTEAEAVGIKVVNYLNSTANKQSTFFTLVSVTNYSTVYNVTFYEGFYGRQGFSGSVFATKSGSLLFLTMPTIISETPTTDPNIVLQRVTEYISTNFDSTIVSSSFSDGLYNYTASYKGNKASFYFTADGTNMFRSPINMS